MLDEITKRLQKNNGLIEKVLAVVENERSEEFTVAARLYEGNYASWRVNTKDDSCNIGVYCSTAKLAIESAFKRMYPL